MPLDQRFLGRGYSAEELDRGEGMTYHPDYGLPLSLFEYDDEHHQFRGHSDLLDRIGCSLFCSKGDPYPQHWNFDPFSGALIRIDFLFGWLDEYFSVHSTLHVPIESFHEPGKPYKRGESRFVAFSYCFVPDEKKRQFLEYFMPLMNAARACKKYADP